MRYTIHMDYRTGDSYNPDQFAHGDVGVTWKNLDVAKAALKIIKEHHIAFKKKDSWRATQKDEEAFRNLPSYNGEFSILLPLDDGTTHSTYTFWHGYFDRLNTAEIIPVLDEKEKEEENAMKFDAWRL